MVRGALGWQLLSRGDNYLRINKSAHTEIISSSMGGHWEAKHSIGGHGPPDLPVEPPLYVLRLRVLEFVSFFSYPFMLPIGHPHISLYVSYSVWSLGYKRRQLQGPVAYSTSSSTMHRTSISRDTHAHVYVPTL